MTCIVEGLNYCSEVPIFLQCFSTMLKGDETFVEMAKIFQISPGLMSQLVYYPVIPVPYLTCYTKLPLEKDPRIYKAVLATIFFPPSL